MKTSNNAPFDVLTFDVLTRETFLQEVGGSVFLKRCLQALPLSLPGVFRSLAISLLARFFSLFYTDREPGTDSKSQARKFIKSSQLNLAPVVQTFDNAIKPISIGETICVIQ